MSSKQAGRTAQEEKVVQLICNVVSVADNYGLDSASLLGDVDQMLDLLPSLPDGKLDLIHSIVIKAEAELKSRFGIDIIEGEASKLAVYSSLEHD